MGVVNYRFSLIITSDAKEILIRLFKSSCFDAYYLYFFDANATWPWCVTDSQRGGSNMVRIL